MHRILDVLLKVPQFNVELSTQSNRVGTIMDSICCDYHAEHIGSAQLDRISSAVQGCRVGPRIYTGFVWSVYVGTSVV